MDHDGNTDLWTLTQFPRSRPSFFFVNVPTVLLEEHARTFPDALHKLYEDQSAAEYVEYFQALETLLANYHTTIRTPAADATLRLALATSATPATRCCCCGRAPPRGCCISLACRQGQSLRNKSRCLCLIGFHAKLSSRPAGQRTIWASEVTIGLGISPV